MRIGYWKSGWVGIDFTQEEVDKLGGLDTVVDITLAKRKAKELDGTVFWVRACTDQSGGNRIRRINKPSQSRPELIAHARNNKSLGWGTGETKPLDFAMLDAQSVEYVVKERGYRVVLDWTKRKPAHTGKTGVIHHKQEPSGAALLATRTTVIGNEPMTIENLLTPRIKSLLDKLNYVIRKNPGCVKVFVKEDGTVGANVSVFSETV